MNDKIQFLSDDTKTLQDMVMALQFQVESLQDEKQQLIEPFRLAQQKQFGASSEGHSGQGELFNEAEAEVEQLDVEPVQETIEYTRSRSKRKPLPKNLPREVVVVDIADEDKDKDKDEDEDEDKDKDKACACCNGDLHKIG